MTICPVVSVCGLSLQRAVKHDSRHRGQNIPGGSLPKRFGRRTIVAAVLPSDFLFTFFVHPVCSHCAMVPRSLSHTLFTTWPD
jgi:hypothetical protein